MLDTDSWSEEMPWFVHQYGPVTSSGDDLYQPPENLETREAWLFSFWNDYGKKEKTYNKLTEVESIVINFLGLLSLSEV